MKLFRTTDDTTANEQAAREQAAREQAPREENEATALSADPATPAHPATPADYGRPSSAALVTEGEFTAQPATADEGMATPADQPQPTFTPAPADGSANGYAGTLAVDEQAAALPADDRPADARPADEPVVAFTADEPLLANSARMRASWQTVQAEFVDDPKAAVMDAADLIEQAAQSLIEALQQRQRQLRVLSDRGTTDGGAGRDPAGPGSAAPDVVQDTEHLRLMMQRYRTLFDQLCRA